MRIYCDRQALADAVNNVQRAVASKSALPALEGILLRATGTSLFLAGYDMELGITTTIEAKVEEQGEIVLTAKLFSEILRRMPADEILIESNEKKTAPLSRIYILIFLFTNSLATSKLEPKQ